LYLQLFIAGMPVHIDTHELRAKTVRRGSRPRCFAGQRLVLSRRLSVLCRTRLGPTVNVILSAMQARFWVSGM